MVSETPKGLPGWLRWGRLALLAAAVLLGPAYGQGTGDPGGRLQQVCRDTLTRRHASGEKASRSRRQATSSALGAAQGDAAGATKAQRMARTARIKKAFVASTELRPMAQQLTTLRTPAAYAGVTA